MKREVQKPSAIAAADLAGKAVSVIRLLLSRQTEKLAREK
jgi:hypothetical protein